MFKKINLKGKTAMVTGAGKGIGKACAIALAEAGAKVVIISRTLSDLIKGENVMLGYWNLKEETERVIKDGWLHTGDIGELDQNNYLKITDRKKDIIVNLGGDNISPSKIENILCLNEFIKQSFVYGDKKNYLVALVVTEKEINKEKIKLIIENINKSLTLIEKVKKFVLINEEFSIENGMLTPTLKLKRKEIIKKYKQQLENLY